MTAAPVLVDGEPRSTVDAADRGLAFGDGVFRTLRVRAGRPLNWRRHLERLRADCALLGIAPPPEATLLAELARVAPGDAVARITVTRGTGGRGYAPPGNLPPTRIVASFPVPEGVDARALDGVRVRRCGWVLAEQPRLAGAKTLNRLENVLARAEWNDAGIAEGLLADAAGRLVEGTMSNVFVVQGGEVATPSIARSGVAGAQRARVMELLREAGVACPERDIDFASLEGADEIFLTNSVIGAWPVAQLEGRRWTGWPVARRVQAMIEEDDARA